MATLDPHDPRPGPGPRRLELGGHPGAGATARDAEADTLSRLELLAAERDEARERAAMAEDAHRRLLLRLETAQRHFEEKLHCAEERNQCAERVAASLKEIHASLFRGGLHALILDACLRLTGATRGVYLSTRGKGSPIRVRAAVGVNGYPDAPPSDFLVALCERVLESRDTIVCTSTSALDGFPPPPPGEEFRNCVATSVVLLRNFDGIIVAADKLSGDFSEADIETLLAVGDQAAIAVENARLHDHVRSAYLATVSMLADAVEAKDPYTQGHCEEVARYARLIADRLMLPEPERRIVCYAALLHDVGKIGVSDGVLNKPGPLLPEEIGLVRAHVRVGHDLLLNVPALRDVAHAVLHHHEWYDGTGYPEGLSGESIPMASRVVGVVDAYCAMVRRRSYKEPYSTERARSELRRCSGSQFDPRVVETFLEVLDSPEAADPDADFTADCGLLPEQLLFPASERTDAR